MREYSMTMYISRYYSFSLSINEHHNKMWFHFISVISLIFHLKIYFSNCNAVEYLCGSLSHLYILCSDLARTCPACLLYWWLTINLLLGKAKISMMIFQFWLMRGNNQIYYTSREDSWFWLVKGHGLIVMISSLLGDRLLSLTAHELFR